MKFFVFVLFINVSIFVNGQNEKVEKNSFSLNVMGCSSLGGITYDRNIGNYFHTEIGIGLIGVGAGLTCYPIKIKESKFCPYFGLKLSSLALVDVGGGTVAYIPLGFTYFSPYKINIGFDIGPARGKWKESSFGNTNPQINYFYIYGNIKIGFRIK
tara:strand:- start:400 stop:867 length:468 start_codon:yes stop_codon:yes gene_type:complete